MKQFIKLAYRTILPLSLRERIKKSLYDSGLKRLRKEILSYYSKIPPQLITTEQAEIIEYIKVNELCNFPYNYTDEYKPEDIKVYNDNVLKLKYVLFEGKRLYFKRSWNDNMIKSNYNDLLIEQDKRSPHLYLTNRFFVEDNSVIVDIGVAEGNFSLNIVEKAKKIYLFETNPEWIEALNATFAPWKEKVEIVNKYVSNINDDNNVSFDSFFNDKGKIDFLKIDVDGAEEEVIDGCKSLLKSANHLKIALCTYHKQNDEQIFSELLTNYGFEITFSSGYMIFINHGLDLKPPYFRRGLIRATR